MKLHEERGLDIKDPSFKSAKMSQPRPRKDKGQPRLPAAAELANLDFGVKSQRMIREEFSAEKTLDITEIEQEVNSNPALLRELSQPAHEDDDAANTEICRKFYSNADRQKQSEKRDLEYLLKHVMKKRK